MSAVKDINVTALKAAREFAGKIHELVPDAVVKLFGSAARGDMEELSDIDIYIELPDEADMDTIKERLSFIAWETGLKYDQVFQEVLYRKSEVWNSPLRSSPFIKAVMKEGVTL